MKNLVCSKNLATDLRGRGITLMPALTRILGTDEIVITKSFDKNVCYCAAFTKAELDVMIGPGIDKPDLVDEIELYSKEHGRAGKVFIAWYPQRLMKTNGAELSALVLSHALESGKVKAADAMARYNYHFGND